MEQPRHSLCLSWAAVSVFQFPASPWNYSNNPSIAAFRNKKLPPSWFFKVILPRSLVVYSDSQVQPLNGNENLAPKLYPRVHWKSLVSFVGRQEASRPGWDPMALFSWFSAVMNVWWSDHLYQNRLESLVEGWFQDPIEQNSCKWVLEVCILTLPWWHYGTLGLLT